MEYHYDINGRHFFVDIPEGFGKWAEKAVEKALDRAIRRIKKEDGVDEVVVKKL